MKPKRPTETDLLTLVQNGFNSQLPKDREAQAPASGPAPKPKPEETPAAGPPPFVPMVRVTLAIPEDLRYSLKLALMEHRRKDRSRLTQDEYCANAISAFLSQEQEGTKHGDKADPLKTFIRDCMREGGLAEAWIPKAMALLEGER